MTELLTKALAEVSKLPDEEQNHIAALILAELKSGRRSIAQPRVAGLHAGNILYISDDFDDPLPDSFWLGEDE
jgi:hypothetical protein